MRQRQWLFAGASCAARVVLCRGAEHDGVMSSLGSLAGSVFLIDGERWDRGQDRGGTEKRRFAWTGGVADWRRRVAAGTVGQEGTKQHRTGCGRQRKEGTTQHTGKATQHTLAGGTCERELDAAWATLHRSDQKQSYSGALTIVGIRMD